MVQSGEVTITTTRAISDVIFEIDGKINALAEGHSALREDVNGLRNDIKLINERINSVNDRLGSMQYTLSWGVSFVSVLLVALPLIWGLRKIFSFSIKDAIREAVKAELDARGEK